MSESTFKTAFWTMLLAFSLTILLTGLKPREIRRAAIDAAKSNDETPVASRSKSTEVDRPLVRSAIVPEVAATDVSHRQTFPQEMPTPSDLTTMGEDHEEDIVKAPLPPPPIQEFRRSNVDRTLDHPKPVRVAFADENQSLGFTTQEEVAAERTPYVPFSRSPLLAPSAVDHSHDLANNPEIAVPEPPGRLDGETAATISEGISELRQDVLQLRLAEAERELRQFREYSEIEEAKRLRVEIDRLRSSIEDLRLKQAKLSRELTHVPELSPLVPASGSTEEQRPIDTKSAVKVTPGETPGHFDFRFENVEIRRVLEVISFHAKRKIVVERQIDGTFSGEFLDVEPRQAFATFVNANGFGLSPKGDYLLVRRHRSY